MASKTARSAAILLAKVKPLASRRIVEKDMCIIDHHLDNRPLLTPATGLSAHMDPSIDLSHSCREVQVLSLLTLLVQTKKY